LSTKIIKIIFAALLALPVQGATLLHGGQPRITIFSSRDDVKGMAAMVKGKVISYSAREEYDKKDLLGHAQDKSQATVRLYDAAGIDEGDTLFVIDDKNLIVAKMKVKTLFKSESFGEMLVGYGNFRLGKVGERVVRLAKNENSKYSYIYKARGDYYENTGKEGEAIEEYNLAIKLDPDNPNAHYALGLIYKKQGLYRFALREFQDSYAHMHQMYDKSDRFGLLRNMAEIMYKQVYESFTPARLRQEYREDGIRYCKEGLRIYSESGRLNYILGMFYSRWSNPNDKAAREAFLKAVEVDPSNSDAYLALSKLYYKHDNFSKARLYAEKALKADARNESARLWLKKIEEKQQK